MFRRLSLFSLSAIFAGCTTLPHFDYEHTDVTPRHVIDAIECELAAVDRSYFWSTPPKTPSLSHTKNNWVAVAELTLQVDEQMTLTPAGTQSSTVLAAATRVFDWGAKLDTTSQRVYNETIVFDIKQKPVAAAGKQAISPQMPLVETKPDACAADYRKRSLTAGLGLAEVSRLASESAQGGGRVGADNSISKSKAAYGTSVQFVITANINGVGPTWNMSHFKGPGKMFLAQRMDTHKIIISFAEVTPKQAVEPTQVIIVGDKPNRTASATAIKDKSAQIETLKKAMSERVRPLSGPTVSDQERVTANDQNSRDARAIKELEADIDRERENLRDTQRTQSVTVRGGSAGGEGRDEAINRALNNNNNIKLQGLGTTINGRLQ